MIRLLSAFVRRLTRDRHSSRQTALRYSVVPRSLVLLLTMVSAKSADEIWQQLKQSRGSPCGRVAKVLAGRSSATAETALAVPVAGASSKPGSSTLPDAPATHDTHAGSQPAQDPQRMCARCVQCLTAPDASVRIQAVKQLQVCCRSLVSGNDINVLPFCS
jgi:hypothetical protein